MTLEALQVIDLFCECQIMQLVVRTSLPLGVTFAKVTRHAKNSQANKSHIHSTKIFIIKRMCMLWRPHSLGGRATVEHAQSTN